MAPSRRIEDFSFENLVLRDAVSDETAPQDEVFKQSLRVNGLTLSQSATIIESADVQ
jgi:hypothetical protein